MTRNVPVLAVGLDVRCFGLASFAHIAWECQHRSKLVARPHNPLDARFGWGSCETLTWLAEVQKRIWVTRHGDPELRSVV